MYNENFLGKSDVSILKFFYASFKIQQSKGNISDVGEFIDTCANTATSTVEFANEENLYRLERQFRNGDSIKIIRKQVEKYEELVEEQAERMERVRRNSEEMERLRKEAESLKGK